MILRRSALFIAWILLLPSAGLAQTANVLNEYDLQPDVWRMAKPAGAGVDGRGDLNLSLPILTIPGRNGLDYEVRFSYRSGITVEQQSTWVGLGWSFDPGSIVRDVQSVVYNQSAYNVDFAQPTVAYQPDLYYVTVPGALFSMTRGNSTGSTPYPTPRTPQVSEFHVTEWEPWDVDYETQDPVSVTGSAVTLKTERLPTYGPQDDMEDFSRFILTDPTGLRYVFAAPTISTYDTIDPSDPTAERYVKTWRLVAILGRDYDGDQVPGKFSSGSWIKLEYENASTAEGVETTMSGATNYVQFRQLKAIETPTHRAVFDHADKPVEVYPQPFLSADYVKLTGIRLYTNYSGANVELVKEVRLTHGTHDAIQATRLALEEIDFYGEGGHASGAELPGYDFTYFGTEGGTLETEQDADDFGFFDAGASPNADTLDGRSWSLRSILHPSGAYDVINYENDRVSLPFNWQTYSEEDYHLSFDIFDAQGGTSTDDYVFTASNDRQGGSRVLSVKRYENQNQSTLLSSTQYSYGEGRVSGIPQRYWERHYGGDFYKPNARGRAGVFYAHVREDYSDGTFKTARYTTDTTYPDVEPLKATLYQSNWGFTVIQANEDMNWGVPYETETSTGTVLNPPDLASAKLATCFAVPSEVNVLWRYASKIPYVERREYRDGDATGKFITRRDLTYDLTTGLVTEEEESGDGVENPRVTRTSYAHDQYGTLDAANVLTPIYRQDVAERLSGGGLEYHRSTVTTWQSYWVDGHYAWHPHETYVWSVDDPQQSEPSFSTSSSAWQLTIRNETYDAYGQVTSRTDALGTQTELFYGSNVSNLSHNGAFNHAVLTGIRRGGSGGLSREIDYDAGSAKVVSITDPSGVETGFTYDAHGRLDKTLGALGLPVAAHEYAFSRIENADVYDGADPNRIRTTSYGAANLLSDPSMETTSGYDSEKWRKSSHTTGTYAVDGSTSAFGGRSLKAGVSGSQRVLWDAWYEIAVDDADDYRMKVWAKTAGGYTGGATFAIFFRNASNGYVGDRRISVPSGDRDWTAYETSFTPPAGATKAYAVYLNWTGDGSSAGTVWWDGASFEHLPGDHVVTEYLDSRGLSIQRHERDGGYDIIAASDYDEMGRLVKSYNPYRTWNSAHNYRNDYDTQVFGYYDGSPGPDAFDYPYEESVYDWRGRLQKVYGAGLGPSLAPRDYRKFFHWRERARDASGSFLSGHYAVDVSQDEIGGVVSSAEDALGRTILSRRHVDVLDDGSAPANASVSASKTGGTFMMRAPSDGSSGHHSLQSGCDAEKQGDCADADGGVVVTPMDEEMGWDYDTHTFTVPRVMVVSYSAQLSESGTASARVDVLEGGGSLRSLLYVNGSSQSGYFLAYPGVTYEVKASAGASLQSPGSASASCDVIFTENGRMTVVNQTRFEPDITGSPVTVMPPNYFDPPSGSSAGDWDLSYDYDTEGRLQEKTTPDDGTTKFKYDEAGNVRFQQSAKQANATKVLFTTYDGLGRTLVTGEATAGFSSLDGESSYSFESTTANWKTARAYDAKPSTGSFPWNQFSSEISGADMHYLEGRLAGSAQKSDGVWQLTLFSYDDDGRLERRTIYTDATGAVDAEIVYRYDRQGRLRLRTSEVDPSSHRFRQWYEYNERGLLERVYAARSLTRPSNPEVEYTYDAAGQVASTDFEAGSAIPYDYNARGWLTGIADVTSGSGTFAAAYAYEPNGLIAESEYRQYDSPSSDPYYKYVYDYDRMGRLLEADSYVNQMPGWHDGNEFDLIELAYDANGNLTKLRRRDENGTSIDHLTYSYGSNNRVSSLSEAAGSSTETWDAEGGSFTYDANGNVTATPYGPSSISYHYRNLPVSMTVGGVTTDYRYSDGGERYWKKTSGGSGEHYVLDGAATVGVFREDGTYHWNILVGGAPVGRITNTNAAYYYLKDHLGSTRAVINSSGTVVETRDFYPFGLQMPGRTYLSGSAAKEDFTGHELDAETGLIYAGARYLDPAIGRWQGVDPLADKYPAWSPYNYALANPGNMVDPNGKEPNRSQAANLQQILGIIRGHFQASGPNIQLLRYTQGAGGGGRQVGPFGGSSGARYVYTTKKGWIDLAHMFQVAATSQEQIGRGWKKVAAKTLWRGFAKEMLWSHTEAVENAQHGETKWSYEDAPSNMAGLTFYLDYYTNDDELVEAIEQFLLEMGIVDPTEAPNWEEMQQVPQSERWFRQNKSFDPVLNPALESQSGRDPDTRVCEASQESC